MKFPIGLSLTMTEYLLRHRIAGTKRYPLVLMLEPTHRCNLQCAGCGRIREYRDTLDREMSLDDCIDAVEVTGTPVVTITGGEPLLYSHMKELVGEVLKRKRYIFFCTNGLLMEEALGEFQPHGRFFWNVHLDGTARVHDEITGRHGSFQKALKAVEKALEAGFQVITNTTVYRETDLDDLEQLFTILSSVGVKGILVAPGFSYSEVDEEIFLTRQEIIEKFRVIRGWTRRFPIMSNPIYLDFCAGLRSLGCTPWGNPTRNVKGWKSPCYLITDAHYPTYEEFMEKTDWDYYASGRDSRCKQCMVHCGYEPTVVRSMSLRDAVRMMLWNIHG
ncbi:adenosyl-hopene transferase HpnH [Thermodesulforhabdus norvegica]|uniref:Hopanoid biosynthesis associated radical SAM protein HpnH n=1 Tax=Thermodesulforhabdus norvegica TaxID=39841 RepID=A0A1I4R9D2_9BACT|nr:adenosyl-hopene transferase HpnH [Thermodesulforhabdus norvegica]SFM48902.1 hopanoid biosynthesis associated radical SAM protein HpnH [Thermodesulforhabdus norvegica]